MSSLRPLAFTSLLVLAACPPPKPVVPEPGPLRAAVATRRLDIPVGIAMGGYLRTRPASDPGSPWAKQFPASQGVHSDPTVRVVVLTNGLTRVALIRLDTTIVSPTLRSRLISTLTAAGETANVFIYATHTHAGPARIMPPARLGSATGTDFVSLVMDHYDAEVETRMTSAISEAIIEAFAGLKPVSVGLATVEAGDFNNDRRCENDPVYGRNFRDTALTVIRIDEVDEAGTPVRPLTALLHFAMHGTVLGSDNTLQSTEAPGAFELYASDALGIPALYVQGAAGDVSPRGGPFNHGDLQQLERQGRAQAVLAQEAYARAAPGPAVPKARLDFKEKGVLLSREAFGYARGEFPEFGGIQCAAGGAGPCGSVKSLPTEVICLPLEPRRPFKTAMSLLRIGDLLFFSTPGELGTGLSRKMVAALEPLGATTVLPVGYSRTDGDSAALTASGEAQPASRAQTNTVAIATRTSIAPAAAGVGGARAALAFDFFRRDDDHARARTRRDVAAGAVLLVAGRFVGRGGIGRAGAEKGARAHAQKKFSHVGGRPGIERRQYTFYFQPARS